MKAWEKIVYGLYLIGWIIAPFIANDYLKSRGVILPEDISYYGFLIWYAIGLGQVWWSNRNDPPKRNKNNGPSYTGKGQNDWLNRD